MRPTTAPSASTSKSSSFHSPDEREADARLRTNFTSPSLRSRCAASFDHLVGAQEERFADLESYSLGSLNRLTFLRP